MCNKIRGVISVFIQWQPELKILKDFFGEEPSFLQFTRILHTDHKICFKYAYTLICLYTDSIYAAPMILLHLFHFILYYRIIGIFTSVLHFVSHKSAWDLYMSTWAFYLVFQRRTDCLWGCCCAKPYCTVCTVLLYAMQLGNNWYSFNKFIITAVYLWLSHNFSTFWKISPSSEKPRSWKSDNFVIAHNFHSEAPFSCCQTAALLQSNRL